MRAGGGRSAGGAPQQQLLLLPSTSSSPSSSSECRFPARRQISIVSDSSDSSSASSASSKWTYPRRNDTECVIAFLVIGAASMLGWNCFLSFLPALQRLLFPKAGNFTDTVTAVYFTGGVISAVPFALTGRAKPRWLLVGLAAMCFVCLLLAWCVTSSSEQLISPLLHALGLLMGLAAATICSTGIAVAAASAPSIFVGYLAAGMGFAGPFSFLSWLLLGHTIFDYYEVPALKRAIWAQAGIACGFSFVGFMTFARLQAKYTAFRQQKSSESSCSALWPEEEALELQREAERTSWEQDKHILRFVHPNLLLRVVIFVQTLLVFPTIGPLGWTGDSATMADVNVGVFQCCDFVGRYLPNVVAELVVSQGTLAWLLLARWLLVPIFVLGMTRPESWLFGNAGLHLLCMVALGLTNGWFSTVATLLLPRLLKTANAKSRGSSMGMCVGWLGIFMGQWGSKALKASLGY